MKNRLIRAAGTVTYVARSKPEITYDNDVDWIKLHTPIDETLAAMLKLALADAMAELGQGGLAQYLDDDKLGQTVTSIITSVDGLDVLTTVVAKRELTADELDELEDYVIGQYADGFGEGFEQTAFYEEDDVYEREEENEDGEVEVVTDDRVNRFFCSLYKPNMKLEFKRM